MIETIKTLILDFQEARLETGVPRRLRIDTVHGKAAICIGARRSGKSTYLFQVIRKLLDAGVPRRNILYLNFFDDRLHGLRRENLGLIAEAYYALYPETKNAETVYCFFDEIQDVEGWESFVDRLMRTERCEVYLTGSSARMLSKEIATQMRGRALSWEIFPFSFREFLDFKEIESEGPLSTKKRLLVRRTASRRIREPSKRFRPGASCSTRRKWRNEPRLQPTDMTASLRVQAIRRISP